MSDIKSLFAVSPLRAVIPLRAVLLSFALYAPGTDAGEQCPEYLNHDYRQLHSKNTINLCDKYNGKPLVIVNTASHCGFTKQFGTLEMLYQKYKADGVEVIGFASNDFNQEAKSEAKAARICYENYGVTFIMLAPTQIKGTNANPTFAYLAKAAKQPSWNFNKYLISGKGTNVTHFSSRITPLDSDLESAISKALTLDKKTK